MPIERRADWLVMATRLVLLRSRLLCPATPEAAEQAEREADREVARLGELRFIRAATAWLQMHPQLGIDLFPRGRAGPDPRVASYMALMEACLTVLRGRDDDQPGETPVYRPGVVAAVFRIPDALVRLRCLLIALTEARPLAAFFPRVPPSATDAPLVARSAAASTFVAALELCRGAEVVLEQAASFGPIMVHAVGATAGNARRADAA